MESLLWLVGPGYTETLAARSEIPELAFRLRTSLGTSPSSLEAYQASVCSRTCSLTLLAGSGSRWRKSLELANAAASHAGPTNVLDPERPRGLFPVENCLGRGPERLPIAAYALEAVRALGSHIIVVRGWESQIEEEILIPLGYRPGTYRFTTQEVPYGKPLGHGDAAWQCRALWRNSDYLVTNFGGDANSRFTIEASLLALDALSAAGEDVALLIPAAYLPKPGYPIVLDEKGSPRAFGHAKLQGEGPVGGGAGYTNVGIRIYRSEALAVALEELRERYWVEGKGYAVPGNDPEGAELALDNADALFAARGRARILALARPGELSPVKSLEDVPAFERAVKEVTEESQT